MPPETKRKPGRPRKEINEKLLYDLAKIHCTMDEMAAVLDCHADTLRDNYSSLIKRGMDEGKASLRRVQYQAAIKGNVTAMIWLGKQLLGQRDVPPTVGGEDWRAIGEKFREAMESGS